MRRTSYAIPLTVAHPRQVRCSGQRVCSLRASNEELGALLMLARADAANGPSQRVPHDVTLGAEAASVRRVGGVESRRRRSSFFRKPQRTGLLTSASVRPRRPTMTVSDTGIGIAPDQLPHVFELLSRHPERANARHGRRGRGLACLSRNGFPMSTGRHAIDRRLDRVPGGGSPVLDVSGSLRTPPFPTVPGSCAALPDRGMRSVSWCRPIHADASSDAVQTRACASELIPRWRGYR